MQIVVSGMHRSGTSALARVLNLTGCYVGADDSFNAADEANPKGYWERRDVHRLNEDVLEAVGADWSAVAGFDLRSLDSEQHPLFDDRIAEITKGLEAHRPWAIKDPRLSLTFPLWRRALERPICLIAVRNPLEVARSLQTRDDIPLLVGIGLWQTYTTSALRVTQGLPRRLVSYHDLIAAPVETTRDLVEALQGFGVSGLSQPTPAVIEEFIDPKLHRAQSVEGEEDEWLDRRQQSLWRAIQDGSVLDQGADLDERSPSAQVLDLLAGFGRLRTDRRSSVVRAHELAVEVERLKSEVEVHGPAYRTIVQLEAALEERKSAFAECDRSARSLERALGASEREREIVAGRLDEERSRGEKLEADRARVEHELASLHLQQAAQSRELDVARERLATAEHRLEEQIERATALRSDLAESRHRVQAVAGAVRGLLGSRSLRWAERASGIARGLRGGDGVPPTAALQRALDDLEPPAAMPTDPAEAEEE